MVYFGSLENTKCSVAHAGFNIFKRFQRGIPFRSPKEHIRPGYTPGIWPGHSEPDQIRDLTWAIRSGLTPMDAVRLAHSPLNPLLLPNLNLASVLNGLLPV